MTTTRNETLLDIDPELPTVRVAREFDAPRERVFRAHVDSELFARWIGPSGHECRVDAWDAVTGGGYRYSILQGGDPVARFFGSFHEVRATERLVQTFTWEGMPDGVMLETVTFSDTGDGRTRLVSLSLLEDLDQRDGLVSSGMETGIVDGYAKLDTLLAEG